MAGITIALFVARSLISQCDNVALGAVVTATGDPWYDCSPEKAVDGVWDADCGWTGQGLQELYVDTGDLYLIERLRVGPFSRWLISEYYYVDAWNMTHSTDGVTWKDFAGVTKLQGAGDLGPTGITIANGNPGVGSNEPPYKVYEFTVTPTELRYVRIAIVVGDVDSDSDINEIELCAVPPDPPDGGGDDGGGNGDSNPGDASGSDPNPHPDSHAAHCDKGQYYDLMADECVTPKERSCHAVSGQLAALIIPLLVAGRRRRQNCQGKTPTHGRTTRPLPLPPKR